MLQTTDVAVVGGGVIGCAVAYYLSKRAVKATVFEQGQFGSGASGATAGVVGPLWHLDRWPPGLMDLGLMSLDMFPGLAAELREAGVDPEFRQTGILRLALTGEHVANLKEGPAWQNELGMSVRWLQREDVLEREPEVTPEVKGAVFSPREGCIVGQRFVDALVHAAGRHGAAFLEGVGVTALESKGGRVTGVRTAAGSYSAGHTVLAAGPWTGIAGRWVPEPIPVRPVKGQRVLLRRPGFLPKCPVFSLQTSRYVIPQADGNILVAATREEGKFDERTTAAGIGEMLDAAVASFPVLEDAAFVAARAGVRPGSPDGIPIMGPVPGWDGLSVASGHDHVGVMLAPRSGELMADYVATGDASPLEPFSLARFSTEA